MGESVHPMQDVADTGAQVCVASRGLLNSLSLWPALLQHQAGLKDAANLPLELLGSAVCVNRHGNSSTSQVIYFVDSAHFLFLSLTMCIDLGLVPLDFP